MEQKSINRTERVLAFVLRDAFLWNKRTSTTKKSCLNSMKICTHEGNREKVSERKILSAIFSSTLFSFTALINCFLAAMRKRNFRGLITQRGILLNTKQSWNIFSRRWKFIEFLPNCLLPWSFIANVLFNVT